MDMVDSALERSEVAFSKHGTIGCSPCVWEIFFDPTVGPYAIQTAGPWGGVYCKISQELGNTDFFFKFQKM